MDRTSRVCLGVIVGAKGLKGEVRIKSFTEDPADVGAYGPVAARDGRKFNVTIGRGGKEDVVIAKLSGVADRTQAEALKGVELFVERGALPVPDDGTFYQADLIGAVVKLTSGEVLGTVSALHNFGGGDMMEVGEGHASVLIPLTPEAIAEFDVKGGQVTVHPLPGLLGGESDQQDDGLEEAGRQTDGTDG